MYNLQVQGLRLEIVWFREPAYTISNRIAAPVIIQNERVSELYPGRRLTSWMMVLSIGFNLLRRSNPPLKNNRQLIFGPFQPTTAALLCAFFPCLADIRTLTWIFSRRLGTGEVNTPQALS